MDEATGGYFRASGAPGRPNETSRELDCRTSAHGKPRSKATCTPSNHPDAENLIRLGFDDHGDLVSAVAIERVNPGARKETPEYFVAAVAVSLSQRGNGGKTADDAIADAVGQLGDRVRAAGGREFLLSGRIHQHNAPSQAMAARNGMAPGRSRDGDPYALWRVAIDIE